MGADYETPISKMLAAVEWEPGDVPSDVSDDIPYATHQGLLRIGSVAIRCYRLNDGRAIIDSRDLEQFFFGSWDE